VAAESHPPQPRAKRIAALVYASLLADVALFFHKPLFSAAYLFPWDFRGVQLPMLTFLMDQLHQGHFPLWNPFSYCGYPVFANIEACFFQPLILAAAFIASRTSADSLPMLLEWAVVLQVWAAGIVAYHLFRNFGAGKIPAWTGAVMFQTGGYFASRAEHIGTMMAVAWMPLAWLAVVKLRQEFRPGGRPCGYVCRLRIHGSAGCGSHPDAVGAAPAIDRRGVRLLAGPCTSCGRIPARRATYRT